jgi:hypothetical protein
MELVVALVLVSGAADSSAANHSLSKSTIFPSDTTVDEFNSWFVRSESDRDEFNALESKKMKREGTGADRLFVERATS